MKRRIIKAGVLILIFVAALVISSLVINRGTDDEIVDMGAPTLPRISFMVNENEVNNLFGYVDEMDITAMRDTIIPLQTDGTLVMNLETDGSQVSGIRYEVYSLDGSETYKEGEAELPEEGSSVQLQLGNILSDDAQEAVLKVILTIEDGDEISYYTRIVRPDEVSTSECLSFAQDFHTKALNGEASEELSAYLEPGEESDNTTYQTVNIHSDITHIQWGELNPEVMGDVEWSIKESNTVYTSILAKYQVSCTDENGEASIYNIKEFFRVRYVEGTIYLLDYNRDMERLFQGTAQEFDEDGILFGIASDDIRYTANSDGTVAAFVQERELWLYNVAGGELTKVFSFADQEGQDVRSRNDQHAVRIISMDEDGNLAFAVYGYMNRGFHEGEVGVGIYYFDVESSLVEEKAFIPSSKSFAIAEDELGKMVYYNHSQSMLYVLADGTLYQINLENDEQTVLAEQLEEGQYAVSDDGHLMAYQTSGTIDTAAQIQVMDLSSGDSYTVDASDGEAVRPLGFVNGDFIFGKINPEDAGVTVSGEEITPMYEIEIRNADNEKEAGYSFTDQNIYTRDIVIENNMITFNRVVKEDSGYNAASQEYVTNNLERGESAVQLESYSTELQGVQQRLTFADGIDNAGLILTKPDLAASREPLTITLGGSGNEQKFYVYGMGELVGIYDMAGNAVQRAEQVSGVVISSDQAYVWEKGNRDLVYSTDAEAFSKEDGETSLEACERYMEQYGASRIDLTGCTLDQVLYVINRGCPVIAITDSNHAVLLTGYTLTDITYIDPDTGGEHTVGINEMESMAEESGNTFIGYIR